MTTVPYTFQFGGPGGTSFLGLVQRAIRECGATGTTIATMVGATGEPQRFGDWINQAWLELQTKHDDWPWMRSSVLVGGGVSFPTVAGQGSYALGTASGTVGISSDTFGKWDRYSFRNNPTGVSTGEIYMEPIDYDVWRDGYMYGAQRNARSRPTVLAVGPSQEICLGPMPADGWTVTGDYYRAPVAMAADDDIPLGLPSQFVMLIVYQAMVYYGEYEAAPEVVTRGQSGYGKMVRELEALRFREITTAGALA